MKVKNILLGLLTFSMLSCESLDDLDSPIGTITEDSFFQNADEAKSSVIAVYDGFQHIHFRSTYQWGDCLTDDAVWYEYITTLFGGLAWGLQTPVGNGVADYHQRIFRVSYQAIVRANFAIRGIENMSSDRISDKERNALIAEAKFLRAFLYHYLNVRWGGCAIASFENSQPKRLSEKETSQWIIKELTESDSSPIKSLPLVRDENEKGRVTRAAAYLLLAKVYQFDGDYENASKAAKCAMTEAKGNHDLISSYPEIFSVLNESNDEVVFEITFAQNMPGEEASDYHYLAYANFDGATNVTGNYPWSYGPIVKPVQNLANEYEMAYDDNNDGIIDRAEPFDPNMFDISKDDINQFKNRDPRLDYTLAHAGSNYFGDDYSEKFLNMTGSTGYCFIKFTTPNYILETKTDRKTENNMIIYRYADVLLTFAESENEISGATSEVYSAVNKVRARVGMPNLPLGLSKDEMREAIRHERRVEFAGENCRYEDLRRWNLVKEAFLSKPKNHRAIKGSENLISFPDYAVLWPIPQLEIDLNPNLEQNPGY